MKNEDNLPSLVDSDIETNRKPDLARALRTGRNVTVTLALGLTAVAFTGCSDDKSCSDGDSTNYYPYDTGTIGVTADPTDYGQVSSYGDSSGNGDNCRDYD